MPDPVVRAGDWIADVTYERSQTIVQNRWWQGNTFATGIRNPNNNGEWDDLPAQRCFWYRVQKSNPASVDRHSAGYRSMMVYVNRTLQARTLMDGSGNTVDSNASRWGQRRPDRPERGQRHPDHDLRALERFLDCRP